MHAYALSGLDNNFAEGLSSGIDSATSLFLALEKTRLLINRRPRAICLLIDLYLSHNAARSSCRKRRTHRVDTHDDNLRD